jgi:hypothetical protein
MGIAVTQVEKTFDDYLAHMTPYAEHLASARARSGHPLLGRDDLLQEAFKELWVVWRNLHSKVDFDHLCKIGSKTMKEIMISSWQRSRTRGQGTTPVVPLDEVTSSFDRSRHDTIPDVATTIEESMEFRYVFSEYCRELSERDRQVLCELLSPSERTMQEMARVARSCKSRRTHVSIRNEGVAVSLGLKPGEVGVAWRRLQGLVDRFMGNTSPSVGYDGHGGTKCSDDLNKESAMKDTKSTLVVDPSEIPGEEDGVEVAASVKTPAPKPPAPKPAASKPAPKLATVSKPEPKKLVPKAPVKQAAKPEPKLAPAPSPLVVGTKVAYLGEARGTLKRGASGVITKQHRVSQTLYEVKFGGETYLLPATHIQKQ